MKKNLPIFIHKQLLMVYLLHVLRAGEDFNRKLAYSLIPKSIGILRDIFKFISLEDLPHQMEVIIDDIAEVLACADAKKILDQYYHEGKGSDPVLTFL